MKNGNEQREEREVKTVVLRFHDGNKIWRNNCIPQATTATAAAGSIGINLTSVQRTFVYVYVCVCVLYNNILPMQPA